jgi:hypothetical protein
MIFPQFVCSLHHVEAGRALAASRCGNDVRFLARRQYAGIGGVTRGFNFAQRPSDVAATKPAAAPSE